MISLLVALLAPAHAAPGVVPIQGVLTDSAGTPVDGDVSVTFRLVTNDTGSIEVWTDTVTVAASNGRFAVDLGANASLDLGLFADHPAMHLGVTVESDSEMPLVPMNHVPYAAWAEEAGTFGGQTAAEFQTTLLDTTDSRYMSSTYLPDWSSLTGVPSDLLDGDDNTTYSGSDFAISNQSCGPNALMVGIGPTGGILCETISEVGYAPAWGDLTGVPTGLDDGDNDTTYSAGLGLELSGTELYISEYAGGPLIPNARFESGFTGWSVERGAAGAVTTVTDGQAGSAVYRATTGQNPWLVSDARIAVRPGQNYRVSGAFRRTDTSGDAGSIYLAVRAFSSAGNNLTGDGAWWYYPVRAVELSDTEWHTYSYGFGPGFGKLLPANAASISVGAILNYANSGAGNRTYEVTNLQLKATDESARTTPQRVFWVETSGGITWTYTSSAWGDHYGAATGTANIGQGPFSWIFSLGGDWVDTANENIYYRIELTNESTGAVSYLPDADGHHRFLYVDNNRLEEFTMHGVSSVAPGAYTAQLQVRIGDGGAYRWNGDAYGDMVFQIF